jgi:hypothetical protein
VGLLYEAGRGGWAKNQAMALKWDRNAAGQGLDRAEKEIDELKKARTP